MAACIGKIRMQGLVDIDNDGDWAERPDHPLYYLVKVEKVALPLYPQFGTQPNIYYIPPRWVPREFLRQMFGPGVDSAIEKYMKPSRTLLGILQLFRATQKMIFRYEIIEGPLAREVVVGGESVKIYNDTVIGYDADGGVATKISVEEPFYVRDRRYQNSI
jgi:nitrate reductase beta subunit